MKKNTSREKIEVYIKTRRVNFNRCLLRYLKGKTFSNQEILEAALYSIRVGGKRLRPILAMATAEGLGRTHLDILPFARAIEMIHTYSLVHDDLPAMDDDTLRRGHPTTHVVHGEETAFLAGIFLLEVALRGIMADPGRGSEVTENDRKNTAEVLAEAAGIRGMIGGQMADMSATGVPIDLPTLQFIHAHKTGCLITAAIYGVSVWFNAPDFIQRKLLIAGRKMGLAFQIIDDILDVEQSSGTLGKTAGKDASQGKTTYPGMFGLEEAKSRARQLNHEVHRELGRLRRYQFDRLLDLSSYMTERIY